MLAQLTTTTVTSAPALTGPEAALLILLIGAFVLIMGAAVLIVSQS